MTIFPVLLMLAAPQSAPPQPPLIPKPYTVEAINPPMVFLDSTDTRIVYLSSRMFYTESGVPVAYLDGNDVYRFNGKHLGWLRDKRVFDHDGNTVVIGVVESNQRSSWEYRTAPPIKAPQEPAPILPALKLSWSSPSAWEFFTGEK